MGSHASSLRSDPYIRSWESKIETPEVIVCDGLKREEGHHLHLPMVFASYRPDGTCNGPESRQIIQLHFTASSAIRNARPKILHCAAPRRRRPQAPDDHHMPALRRAHADVILVHWKNLFCAKPSYCASSCGLHHTIYPASL